jgi:site-specific recombinase XerD
MMKPRAPEPALSTASAWAPIIQVVLAGLRSTITKTMYRKAIEGFLDWQEQHGSDFNQSAVRDYLVYLESVGYAPATLNLRLSAIRRFVAEAANCNLLPLGEAVGICRVRNVRQMTAPSATSLSRQKSEELINAPDGQTTKGMRDRVLLALLVGCALRRREAVNLDVEDIQYESGRAVLIRVVGQRGRIRSVAIPDWIEEAIAQWLSVAQIKSGPLLRAVSRLGTIASSRLSPQTVFNTVQEYGKRIGVVVRPHDLRRTCAKLCCPNDAGLDQIRVLLGHASLATTARYLSGRQNVSTAASERVRLRWKQAS